MIGISSSIQRLTVRSFLYQPIDVRYKNKKDFEIPVADALSRVSLWKLKRKVLEVIHEGHQGVKKCLPPAWESIFW